MPKLARELQPLDVKRLKHPGTGRNVLFAVGGVQGLQLQITPTGSRSWVLRVSIGGKRRDVGLGGYPTVTLAQAREKAREARASIERGVDPVEDRKAARAALETAARRGTTFAEAMSKYLTAKIEVGEQTKHRAQWRTTLESYAVPILGKMSVADIGMPDVLRVLEPIWAEKTETASRVRQRIEAVLSWATVAGLRSGDNPARWRGNLAEMLPAPAKLKGEEHHPAVALADGPRWWAHLCRMDGQGARALRFAVLCASRSGEIRGLRWREVVFEGKEPVALRIPAARMKGGREHMVPLSDVAVELLREVAGLREGDAWPELPLDHLVFPAPRGGELSDMTLSAVMRRMHEAEVKVGRLGYLDGVSRRPAVPHGCRSTFRDWAGKSGFPRELGEEALAHSLGSAVEAAYARGHLMERRRPMMQAWANFLAGDEAASVVPIRAKAAQ